MTDTKLLISLLINIVFIFFSLRLASRTNLIKDDSEQLYKPYSFAKSQLLWWTLIIISVFIWCAVYTNSIPQLNPLCLALLGISAGTTAAGAMIDNMDKGTPGILRHQDKNACTSFIQDILSDQNGNYAIHRFQSFIFNLSIGVIFLWIFFTGDKESFPGFDKEQTNYILGLLGVSNLGFAGIKTTENKKRKDEVGKLKDEGKTDEEIRNILPTM